MEVDLTDPAAFAEGPPHEALRRLRAADPVHWHPERDGPGFWALTRHAEVCAVGRDPETFSSEPTILIPDPPPGSLAALGEHRMMLTMDPPRHTRYRRLISRGFTPRAARALVPRARELACAIVDAVIERGECDLVADVAGEMPSFVIAELMGIPLEDGRELYGLTETIHAAPGSVPEGAQERAVASMFEYAKGVIEAKRARPADDLATRLLRAEVEGERLDELDFQLFFLLLVDAGGDTTRNLVAGGLLALLERPEAWRRLREEREALLPSAREELLRFVSPVVYMRRTATRPTELGGRRIAEGEKVVMYYGSANRDERVFDAPDALRLDRAPNPHVAFGGGGAHFCLGAHVARVEIDALLDEILRRMPGLELAGTPRWLESTFVAGPRRMPVRFPPGPREGSASRGGISPGKGPPSR